jgi:hypothetical protein
MTYRDHLAAATARKDALEHEIGQRNQELAAVRGVIDELQARVRLPVLANLKVAAPCAASWDAMTGDAQVRHCGDCKQDVYNLSEMTRDEAEQTIAARAGKLCVRYYQRADGTILLKDCAVGVKRRRRRRLVVAGVAASLAGAALVHLHRTHVRATLGDVDMRAVLGELRQPGDALEVSPPAASAPHVKMGRLARVPELEAPVAPHVDAGKVAPPPAPEAAGAARRSR